MSSAAIHYDGKHTARAQRRARRLTNKAIRRLSLRSLETAHQIRIALPQPTCRIRPAWSIVRARGRRQIEIARGLA
jgi:hypothetical protein